jgi:hypothetical protein
MNALIAAIDRAHASAKYVSFSDRELAVLRTALQLANAMGEMPTARSLYVEICSAIDARPSMLVRS